MVLQMLDLLSSRRSVEMGGPAGGKDLGGGGGGKAILDASIEFQSVDNIREGRNINMREEDEVEEEEDYRRKNFKWVTSEEEVIKGTTTSPIYTFDLGFTLATDS